MQITPEQKEWLTWSVATSIPLRKLGADCVFHAKLDTHSTANWTPSPAQTGHAFHGKLDTRSKPNWTPVPSQTGHLGRNGAGLRCGFTPDGANLSN